MGVKNIKFVQASGEDLSRGGGGFGEFAAHARELGSLTGEQEGCGHPSRMAEGPPSSMADPPTDQRPPGPGTGVPVPGAGGVEPFEDGWEPPDSFSRSPR